MGIRRMVLAAAILVAPVLALAQALTPRGVDCEAFRKKTNGHWTVVKQTTIKRDVGQAASDRPRTGSRVRAAS
jgi:hypothetical protein